MAVWGLAQPFAGVFMDSRGPRRVIVASVIVMAAGFVAAASAQNMWQLIIGYSLLVGGSASGLAVAAFSVLISRWFGQQQRGRAIGFALAGIPMGSIFFAPLTSLVANNWSWRVAFLFLAAILIVVALPLVWFFLHEPTRAARANPAPASRGGLFLSTEVRQAVKTRAYWLMLLAYFGCGSSALFLQGHLPAIGLWYGFSPQVGARALGLVGVGGAIGAMLGGWASDRFGRYPTLMGGYFLRGVGFFLLALNVSDVSSFYFASLVAGLPIFLTITVTQTLIYEIFGAGIAGRMLGLTFLLHQVGSTAGPYLGGRAFEALESYQIPLLIGGGVLWLSVFWGWRLQVVARGMAQRGETYGIPPAQLPHID
jgi:MFS family permease